MATYQCDGRISGSPELLRQTTRGPRTAVKVLVWLGRVTGVGSGESAFEYNEIARNAKLESSDLVGSVL